MTVRLRHPELERAGFQLTARFAEGPRKGWNAGALRAKAGMEILHHEEGPRVAYLQQTLEGTEVEEPGEAVWTFRWRAPEKGGPPVVFHVSANAANYDLSEVGDYVYVLERSVTPREGG